MTARAGETLRQSAYRQVSYERARQIVKWGKQAHDDLYWLGILIEEIGELAKAIIESKPADIKSELIQVAAVAVAWHEWLEDTDNDARTLYE